MANKKSNAAGYQAPAVGKAFDILRIVADSHMELGVSELAKALGFSKSTTHGLVNALLRVGALDENPQRKKFFLGPAVVELAFRSWNYLRVAEHAQPLLDVLRDRIGETVFLGALSRSRGVIMATAVPNKPLKISSPPGTTIPLLAGAVGKAFMAQKNDDQVKHLIKRRGLPKFTAQSIVSERRYLKELVSVRKQGYALDNEEYIAGVKAVAVGLGNQRGLPLAIWVVGFADSMKEEAMAQIVSGALDVAKELRALLDEGH